MTDDLVIRDCAECGKYQYLAEPPLCEDCADPIETTPIGEVDVTFDTSNPDSKRIQLFDDEGDRTIRLVGSDEIDEFVRGLRSSDDSTFEFYDEYGEVTHRFDVEEFLEEFEEGCVRASNS